MIKGSKYSRFTQILLPKAQVIKYWALGLLEQGFTARLSRADWGLGFGRWASQLQIGPCDFEFRLRVHRTLGVLTA